MRMTDSEVQLRAPRRRRQRGAPASCEEGGDFRAAVEEEEESELEAEVFGSSHEEMVSWCTALVLRQNSQSLFF